MILKRTTKYTSAVKEYISRVGHATNSQILQHLRQEFPELSATTIHRITTRMVERGELIVAPVDKDSAARFDFNISPHDHFHCLRCDRLQDVELPQTMFDAIENMMDGCRLNGRLIIQGSCDKCVKHTDEL